MTKAKHPAPAGMKRANGHLVCDACKFTIPYQGFDDAVEDNRPTHRCLRDIQPFSRFTLKDPSSIRSFAE